MAIETGVEAILVEGGTGIAAVLAVLGDKGGADLVIEATGVPYALPIAIELAADGGDVIMLGSPRGAMHEDATKLLERDSPSRASTYRSARVAAPTGLWPLAGEMVSDGRL